MKITKLIPQLGDTEATFEGKMKALDGYFADAIKIEEDRNKADAQLSQILFEKEQIKDNYDPTIENNAYNQFVSNIAPEPGYTILILVAPDE